MRRSRNPLIRCQDKAFWDRFGMGSRRSSNFPPNVAERASNAVTLFNRLTENGVTVADLRATGDSYFNVLADGYEHYVQYLRDNLWTDQAHLQRHFLDYLDTPAGAEWLGNGFTVVVDEYQDANAIQEEIYFRLARGRGDLTVVGDDDQSLYRFRGAQVESLVDFDRICHAYIGRAPTPLYLFENRRSHPAIVDWVNRYIEHHPAMHDPTVRVRAPGKPSLRAVSEINGRYPAIMAIVEKDAPTAAPKLANAIRQLKEEGLVEDYSQIAVLSSSTRETSHSIGTYIRVLRNSGIPVYNPRNKAAQREARFQELVGALSCLLDADATYETMPLPGSVVKYITKARAAYEDLVVTGEFPGVE
jgi:DNA helicase-2/ATP-dependent DNA helicase PcrA